MTALARVLTVLRAKSANGEILEGVPLKTHLCGKLQAVIIFFSPLSFSLLFIFIIMIFFFWFVIFIFILLSLH